jgi:hypothetical protein
MAVSGTISATTFNTRRVIDHAFRRCRLTAQAKTPEMQDYARDSLYLLLSEIASVIAPSWCVEKQLYPLYQGQALVTTGTGTVEVMNANLRTLQQITPAVVTSTALAYSVDLSTATAVNTVGIKWAGASVALTFEVSSDDVIWTTVDTQSTSATVGQWTWTDISPSLAYRYFRITALSAISYSEVFLGNLPQEIPMGLLNRDTYVAQSNKVFEGRPLTYWPQRERGSVVLNLWPAPNLEAEYQQLVVWRHRHIMDVGTLQQEIEVPQRWMEAIIAGCAARVAAETPSVDINLLPRLDQKYAEAYLLALNGDNSGASTFIQPAVRGYTR